MLLLEDVRWGRGSLNDLTAQIKGDEIARPVHPDALSKPKGLVLTSYGGIRKPDIHLQPSFSARLREGLAALTLWDCFPLFLRKLGH